MVVTTPDLSAALAQQVAYIDSIADRLFPANASAVHELAHAGGAPFDNVVRLYEMLGRVPLQREMHYAKAQSQDRKEGLARESGIFQCTSPEVGTAFMREGYLSKRLPSVAARFDAPTLIIAGRASHVIGAENIRDASESWQAKVHWMDAGHFPYFEKPEAFAVAVEDFLRELGIAGE
ncbi:MAG: hypothetical protein NVS3B20_18710 [Polyangiales bacterium]